MSKGPSKILYAAGGWFLGGIVGSLVAVAVVFGVAAITGAVPGAGVVFAAQIFSFGASVVGAVKGWSAASKAQTEYSAPAPAASYQQSRGQDVGRNGPERSSEISGEYATRNDWAQSEADRRNTALANNSVVR